MTKLFIGRALLAKARSTKNIKNLNINKIPIDEKTITIKQNPLNNKNKMSEIFSNLNI